MMDPLLIASGSVISTTTVPIAQSGVIDTLPFESPITGPFFGIWLDGKFGVYDSVTRELRGVYERRGDKMVLTD